MPYDDQPTTRAVVLTDGMPREDLLSAVRRAREGTAVPLVLEGHGSSGVAVLSLAVHQRRLGLVLDRVTCVGARGGTDPVSGRRLVVPANPGVTTLVVVAAGDDPASREWSAATIAAFRDGGWTVG